MRRRVRLSSALSVLQTDFRCPRNCRGVNCKLVCCRALMTAPGIVEGKGHNIEMKVEVNVSTTCQCHVPTTRFYGPRSTRESRYKHIYNSINLPVFNVHREKTCTEVTHTKYLLVSSQYFKSLLAPRQLGDILAVASSVVGDPSAVADFSHLDFLPYTLS